MSDLKRALEGTRITIKKYDPEKSRPIYTDKSSVSVGRFTDELVTALGPDIIHHPAIAKCIGNASEMERLLEEYAEEEGIGVSTSSQVFVPQELSHLTLNIDRSSNEGGAKRFFCTTADEIVDTNFSGAYYIDTVKISIQDAVGISRPVVPLYMPRKGPGVHPLYDDITSSVIPYFNTYIPPRWERWRRKNPKLWAKLPAKPPSDIIKLLKHVIPIKEEREYFYAWAYTSITTRSFVYLLLCGNPGTGKNRIKLLLRALHGEQNSADGKKETFGANQSKFNSQMESVTMNWFDELKVTPEMEPRMKEYQNPFISIERKGVDATLSTEIYCSMVVSNNELRDNYLPFNARKFAPLVVGKKPLKEVMSESEIGSMSDRLGEIPTRQDVKYVAQIAKWILAVGPKYVGKYRNLEYQGPKFWEIAHASMSRWQKISVLALTTYNNRGPFPGWDESKKAFLWSKAEEALRKKKEFDIGNIHMATARPFFEIYRDRMGNPVFEIEKVTGGVMEDFWVKPISGLKQVQGRISLNSDGPASAMEKGLRPPGMSKFQWEKMKRELKGDTNGRDEEKEEEESSK